MTTKNENIVRYSSKEIDEMIRRGEDMTDWAKVDALTEEELVASIDFEEEGHPVPGTAMIGLPPIKKQITLRLDREIIHWFKSQRPGYQTRINAVLRAYVDAQRQ